MSEGIPGHSVEAGLEICRQLGIMPSRVESINIYPMYGTLVATTTDGVIRCHLVPEESEKHGIVFRIVKDEEGT